MHDESNDEIRAAVEAAAEAIGGQIMTDVELAAFVEEGERAEQAFDDQARAEGRRFLDEEQDGEVIAQWYRRAGETKTVAAAAALAHSLILDYRHDYGTICHATTAAALAMASALNESDQGGLTGFQASLIGWGFMRRWLDWDKAPRRMINTERLLYPQSDHEWNRLPADHVAWLQKRAAELLAEHPTAHPDVRARWEDIAAGRFPSFVQPERSDGDL
jgi:hypothetical protein